MTRNDNGEPKEKDALYVTEGAESREAPPGNDRDKVWGCRYRRLGVLGGGGRRRETEKKCK